MSRGRDVGCKGTKQVSASLVYKRKCSLKPASNFVLLIVPRRYFCGGSFCFMSWCLKIVCVFIVLVKLR